MNKYILIIALIFSINSFCKTSGYVYYSKRWTANDVILTDENSHPIITACWDIPSPITYTNPNTGDDETIELQLYKDLVAHFVKKNWTQYANISVNFIERPSPDITGNCDVYIVHEDIGNNPHTVGHGTDLKANGTGVRRGIVLNFSLVNWSNGIGIKDENGQYTELMRKRRMIEVALHEFGHVFGVVHEQNRISIDDAIGLPPESQDYSLDKRCSKLQTPHKGDQTVGFFDINSIMNYCNPNGLREGRVQISTSCGDIAAIRALYGTKEGSPEDICQVYCEDPAHGFGLAKVASTPLEQPCQIVGENLPSPENLQYIDNPLSFPIEELYTNSYLSSGSNPPPSCSYFDYTLNYTSPSTFSLQVNRHQGYENLRVTRVTGFVRNNRGEDDPRISEATLQTSSTTDNEHIDFPAGMGTWDPSTGWNDDVHYYSWDMTWGGPRYRRKAYQIESSFKKLTMFYDLGNGTYENTCELDMSNTGVTKPKIQWMISRPSFTYRPIETINEVSSFPLKEDEIYPEKTNIVPIILTPLLLN